MEKISTSDDILRLVELLEEAISDDSSYVVEKLDIFNYSDFSVSADLSYPTARGEISDAGIWAEAEGMAVVTNLKSGEVVGRVPISVHGDFVYWKDKDEDGWYDGFDIEHMNVEIKGTLQASRRFSKKAGYTDLTDWPAQRATEDMLSVPQGYFAYEYGQDKVSSPEASDNKLMEFVQKEFVKGGKRWSEVKRMILELFPDTLPEDIALLKKQTKTGLMSGGEFSTTDWNVNPTLDVGPFSSPADHGATPQEGAFPNNMWQPAGQENKSSQPYSNIASKFSKKTMRKNADDSPLSEDQQNQIASVSSPAYVIALKNYYQATKRGHDKQRSFEYAIESVKNLQKMDPKKLIEFINAYL